MLKQITDYWNRFKVWIIAGAVAVAYFIGITKGKYNEKARQNSQILSDLERGNQARDSLANNSARRRLHDKYKR